MTVRPFEQHIGVAVLDCREGRARLALRAGPAGPALGAVVTLMDAAMAEALRSVLGPGEALTTVELKSSFLARGSGSVEAVAQVLYRNEASFAYAEAEVRDRTKAITARGSCIMKVLHSRGMEGRS